MAQTNYTESKYAKKLVQRRAMGREFGSLGNDQTVRVPMPRPFLVDYIPNYTPKINSHEWRYNPLLPCENLSQVKRIQNPNHVYKRPKIREQIKTNRYNHFEMNYAGWNA